MSGRSSEAARKALNPDEVAQRLAEGGANVLSSPARWGWLRTLLKQFTNLFSLLLDVAAALSFVPSSTSARFRVRYYGKA